MSSVSAAQTFLTALGYYDAGIDGDAGPKTMAAVEIVRRNGAEIPNSWSNDRQAIAALQHGLNLAGFEAGVVDGLWGPNTQGAYEQWSGDFDGWERPDEATPSSTRAAWPRQRDMSSFFGPAGSSRATAGKCQLPFPFVIAWNTSQKVSRFSCHELVAAPMTKIFAKAAAHYGEDRFRELRLDRFGGCYNNRNKRGGRTKSTHAFGIAVDLDPERNQLRWNRHRAAFAGSEYDAFWRIVESEGAVSLGRSRDFDWMHFQFARL